MTKDFKREQMLTHLNEKARADSNKERDELYHKKYLGEIIAEERPEFGSNNLILAPVGSGKSYVIEKMLIPENYNRKVLYLTSNSALKDSLCPNDNEIRKKLADKGMSLRFFTTQNKSKFGSRPYSVHVMTYAEFGERVLPPNQTFTDDIGLVFCDEIHSLPRYFSYNKSYALGIALNWLLKKYDDKQIFYFTATNESIEKLGKHGGYLDNIKVFNYIGHPEIREYIANATYYINNIEQLRPHLKAKRESFEKRGHKALAFSKLINEQEKIETIAKEEGFNPIVLWSVNNDDKEMNEEQLYVRDYILNTGNIPEPYNILIINSAMQEGWNLIDDKLDLAILDTTDITEQIQALGRIRKDIDLVIKKTNELNKEILTIKVPKEYLDVDLTVHGKQSLCEDLYIIDEKGRLRKWTTIKKLIESSGYVIEDTVRTIDGKRTRVSVITYKTDNTK